jgi:hypothetical protein
MLEETALDAVFSYYGKIRVVADVKLAPIASPDAARR